MNRYKALAKNTAIFAVGTFGSKILSFIMVFFYSRAMQTAEFGTLDIIINSGSLMLPICMLGIQNAIIRFGLDNEYKKDEVFSVGFVSVGLGLALLALASPLIMQLAELKQYIFYLYAYVLMSSLRHICSYFVRAIGRPKLYAADGIFSTFMTCALTIIFLIPLKMGIRGYLLAIILADFSSVLFLSLKARLYKYVNFGGFNVSLAKKMLAFSLPLIPTSLLWWVVNVSDRYFVQYMVSASANGLYSVAYKVPTILTLISVIFLDAWQISAVEENSSDTRNRFYSNIFTSFQGAIFILSSGMILFAKFITYILLDSSYYPSWKFIPFLLLATVYSCFVQFLGNIYLAEKRSVATLIKTLIGAISNLILNFLLIPIWGPNGAAIATCISYFVVYAVRAVDIKLRNRDIKFASPLVLLNSVITLAQVILMILEPPYWIAYQIAFLLLLCAVNFKSMTEIVKKLIRK
ncbi:MAG: oligosaccharide flippase family protein [Clostridia bacterium]|nr:oligosaccharide flippase family protein [Clostridia bacterium]